MRPAAAILVALSLAVLATPQGTAGDGSSGFFTLTGDDAHAFVLPADLRLARTFPLDTYGLTYERYEQFSHWMFGYCYDFTPDIHFL